MVDQSGHNESNDKLIDELYRRSAKDAPSASLDDAVLKMARDGMAENSGVTTSTKGTTGKGTGSPFSGNWKLSFSMAAVMVLGLVVILRLGVAPDKPGYESVYEPDYDRTDQTQRVSSDGLEEADIRLQKQVEESVPEPEELVLPTTVPAPVSVPEVIQQQRVMENKVQRTSGTLNEATREADAKNAPRADSIAAPVVESEAVKKRRRVQDGVLDNQDAASDRQKASSRKKANTAVAGESTRGFSSAPQPSGALSADDLVDDETMMEKEEVGAATSAASPMAERFDKSIQPAGDQLDLDECIRQIETLLAEGDMIVARVVYEQCIEVYPQQNALENLFEHLE